ncbi:Uncharacterised protein [Klebsiella aerogenes]|nr:Uncharacterised protein [Klebsiella pneumoniae]VFT73531.1 Uncharacterised protein [Klebsiella aerogenes]
MGRQPLRQVRQFSLTLLLSVQGAAADARALRGAGK